MTIASDLAAVEASGTYTAEQKRILKLRIRANALWGQLKSKTGQVTNFSKNGKTYAISFDTALAASFGHTSPAFVLPGGDLVLYVIVKVDGVQAFPSAARTQPFIVRNPFFTDGGVENPLAAALNILADLASG